MTFFPPIPLKTNAPTGGAGGSGGVTASVFCAGFVPGETLPTVLSARCAVPRLTSPGQPGGNVLSQSPRPSYDRIENPVDRPIGP